VSIHVRSQGATVPRVAPLPWGELAGVRVGIVLWGGLAVLDLARLAAAPSYAELAALAILVSAASIGTRTRTGLCSALTGWLLSDGFVTHRFGTLGFDGLHDLAVLALLTGLALVATRVRR
jgi:hypothetical protein